MANLVVIGGAPGSGKTTITKRLHQHFQSVMIAIGWLRQYHLDPAWLKASQGRIHHQPEEKLIKLNADVDLQALSYFN